MGYSGKVEEKNIAISLRKKGFSYKEIQKEVKVSKGTLSIWCRDIILTEKQAERLYKRKIIGAEKGRIRGSKKQQRDRILRTKRLYELGKSSVGRLNKRDRFIAGVGLYAGDGDKGDKAVGFANSNPKIIEFMMSWLREFCNVSEDRFRGKIWIHEQLSVNKSINYWSNITNIPENQFYKPYVVKNKQNSKKIRKKIHEYGVFSIKITDSSLQRTLLGFMGGLLE